MGQPGSCSGCQPVRVAKTSLEWSENSGLHTWNIFQNIMQFRHAPSKKFASPVLDWKCLKNISLKGRQIICLSEAPIYSGSTLDVSSKTQYMLLTSVTYLIKESHSLTTLLLYASAAGSVLLIELNLWKTAPLTSYVRQNHIYQALLI
jgi:hypothetical protein